MPGSVTPGDVYIVCGHVDSTSQNAQSFAPGADDMTDRERLLGDVLQHIWFALMVGWSGGLHTQATIQDQMRASVELVLEG